MPFVLKRRTCYIYHYDERVYEAISLFVSAIIVCRYG
jgi:hypothetical protein